MNATTRPTHPNPAASTAASDGLAPAAAELAHDLLESGWTLTGAAVRVIHTASITDAAGLTVRVSSETGRIRLSFDAAPLTNPATGRFRTAWRAKADGPLPVGVLAAASAANARATNHDHAFVGDLLTAAGWQYVGHDHWAALDKTAEVWRVNEDLDDEGPLRWRIHRPHLCLDVHACDDTPAAVIAALALTPTAGTP